jgi:DNA-binding transcriptional regulator GbsR (MarR family)
MDQNLPPTQPSSAAPEGESALPARARIEAAAEHFVNLWGQMGSNWGIPRSMAEVHALLFIEGRPMNTDEIMRRLDVSRGNASMTLRELCNWGIVSRVHIRGDRKDYFQAEQDVWKLFRTILRERKKREIDPLLGALRACRAAAGDYTAEHRLETDAAELESFNDRLDSMIEFMELVDAISQRFISPSGEGLRTAAELLQHAS